MSLLYVFRASMRLYREKITVSVRHWYLSLCMDGVWSAEWIELIQPADQTPPTQIDKYQRRIDIVIFSWRWAHGRLKHIENRNKQINTLNRIVHLAGFISDIIQGQQHIKFRVLIHKMNEWGTLISENQVTVNNFFFFWRDSPAVGQGLLIH